MPETIHFFFSVNASGGITLETSEEQGTTQARFTLSGCESDRYKVGCDLIHIRFISASFQYKSLR